MLLTKINADHDICNMTTQASARSLEYYCGLITALGGDLEINEVTTKDSPTGRSGTLSSVPFVDPKEFQ